MTQEQLGRRWSCESQYGREPRAEHGMASELRDDTTLRDTDDAARVQVTSLPGAGLEAAHRHRESKLLFSRLGRCSRPAEDIRTALETMAFMVEFN